MNAVAKLDQLDAMSRELEYMLDKLSGWERRHNPKIYQGLKKLKRKVVNKLRHLKKGETKND